MAVIIVATCFLGRLNPGMAVVSLAGNKHLFDNAKVKYVYIVCTNFTLIH
jgi:hypothetical protein